jgi:hypothetical protein
LRRAVFLRIFAHLRICKRICKSVDLQKIETRDELNTFDVVVNHLEKTYINTLEKTHEKMQKVVFNAQEIVDACELALKEGRGLNSVITFGEKYRPGANNTKWGSVFARVGEKHGELNAVRIVNEKHTGRIAPATQAQADAINRKLGPEQNRVEPRDRDPTLNIQKYDKFIETNDDGTPTGELPGEEHLSTYFRMMEFIDQAFYETFSERKASKKIVEPDEADGAPAGALIVSNAKIVRMVQTRVSPNAKKNPGMKLINPMTRIKMKFDKDTGLPTKAQYFDASKPYKTEGKTQFEVLTFDNEPVTSDNIHGIQGGSRITGLINVGSFCITSMGISQPASTKLIVVKPPEREEFSQDDIFGDMDISQMGFDLENVPTRDSNDADSAKAANEAAKTADATDKTAEVAADGETGGVIDEKALGAALEGMGV